MRFATITILFLFFLSFSALASADSLKVLPGQRPACQGDNLFFFVSITNDDASLKHYSLSLSGLDGRAFTQFSPSTVAVPAHSSYNFEFWATASLEGIPNNYVFVITASDVYSNTYSDRALVSLDSCIFVDAQITPIKPVACIGATTPIAIALKNLGVDAQVGVSADLSLDYQLTPDSIFLAKGETAKPTLFVTVPQGTAPKTVPLTVSVSANGRSRLLETLVSVDYCPNLRLYVPNNATVRAKDLLYVPVVVENAGNADDIAVLSLECESFASLSPSEFVLAPSVSGNANLKLAPQAEHGGKSYSCNVKAQSKKFGMTFTAPITITVLAYVGPDENKTIDPEDYVQPANEAEIIIDSSESMRDYAYGMKKIDVAKEFVSFFLAHVSTMKVGLRAYGSQYKTSDSRTCSDSIILSPIASIDSASKQSIIAKANGLQPLGLTAMGRALSDSISDFRQGESNLVVLVSDGRETCGTDPCALAGELRNKGIRVYAIGFDIDELGRTQLRCVAEQTGGRYFDAQNYEDLLGVIQQIFVLKNFVDEVGTQLEGIRLVSQTDENITLQVNLTVQNFRDYTQVTPAFKGLPLGSKAVFEPITFGIARDQKQPLLVTVTLPKQKDEYNVTLLLITNNGEFTRELTLRTKAPFSITGFFTAASPAFMILGLLIVLALAILFVSHYRNQPSDSEEKGGAAESEDSGKEGALPARLDSIKKSLSPNQRPLTSNYSETPSEKELAEFFAEQTK